MALNPETLPGELTFINLGQAAATGAQTGIDISEFIGKIAVSINTLATTGTFALETSDVSGSGYAAFDPAITVGTGAGLTIVEVDTRIAKKFLRAVGGGTMNGAWSAVGAGKKQAKA